MNSNRDSDSEDDNSKESWDVVVFENEEEEEEDQPKPDVQLKSSTKRSHQLLQVHPPQSRISTETRDGFSEFDLLLMKTAQENEEKCLKNIEKKKAPNNDKKSNLSSWNSQDTSCLLHSKRRKVDASDAASVEMMHSKNDSAETPYFEDSEMKILTTDDTSSSSLLSLTNILKLLNDWQVESKGHMTRFKNLLQMSKACWMMENSKDCSDMEENAFIELMKQAEEMIGHYSQFCSLMLQQANVIKKGHQPLPSPPLMTTTTTTTIMGGDNTTVKAANTGNNDGVPRPFPSNGDCATIPQGDNTRVALPSVTEGYDVVVKLYPKISNQRNERKVVERKGDDDDDDTASIKEPSQGNVRVLVGVDYNDQPCQRTCQDSWLMIMKKKSQHQEPSWADHHHQDLKKTSSSHASGEYSFDLTMTSSQSLFSEPVDPVSILTDALAQFRLEASPNQPSSTATKTDRTPDDEKVAAFSNPTLVSLSSSPSLLKEIRKLLAELQWGSGEESIKDRLKELLAIWDSQALIDVPRKESAAIGVAARKAIVPEKVSSSELVLKYLSRLADDEWSRLQEISNNEIDMIVSGSIRDGYNVLFPRMYGTQTPVLWQGFREVVKRVLIPLAKLDLVCPDILPGYDITSKIYIKMDGEGSSRKATMQIVNYAHIVSLTSLSPSAPSAQPMMVDHRYIQCCDGWNALTFLWWQCVAIGFAWGEHRTQRNMKHTNWMDILLGTSSLWQKSFPIPCTFFRDVVANTTIDNAAVTSSTMYLFDQMFDKFELAMMNPLNSRVAWSNRKTNCSKRNT